MCDNSFLKDKSICKLELQLIYLCAHHNMIKNSLYNESSTKIL